GVRGVGGWLGSLVRGGRDLLTATPCQWKVSTPWCLAARTGRRCSNASLRPKLVRSSLPSWHASIALSRRKLVRTGTTATLSIEREGEYASRRHKAWSDGQPRHRR